MRPPATETARVLLLLVQFVLVFLYAERWRLRGMPPEVVRGLAQVGCGIVACQLPFQRLSPGAVCLLTAGVLLLLEAARRWKRLGVIAETGPEASDAFLFPIAILILFLLSRGRPMLYIPAVLIVSTGDAAAALVGRRLGRQCWRAGSSLRTVEGSAAYVAVAAAAVTAYFVRYGWSAPGALFELALPLALLGAAVEAASPRGTDNLTVPLAVHLALRVLAPDL